MIPKAFQQQALTGISYDEYIQRKIDRLNDKQGNLQGYDCPICKNKGYIYKLKDGFETAEDCLCRNIRLSHELIRQSCMTDEIERCTFQTFKIEEPHQLMKERMSGKAQLFLCDNSKPQMFYIGGQSGSGKTHICTAIVGEMLRMCTPVIYMSWRDEAPSLKAKVNDSKAYSAAINKFKRIDVLYIDDFLKIGGNKAPSDADITLAFEIINYRYQRRNLRTIISSEFDIGQISSMDEALGSRIAAMAREYCINIPPDKTKNYRTKK